MAPLMEPQKPQLLGLYAPCTAFPISDASMGNNFFENWLPWVFRIAEKFPSPAHPPRLTGKVLLRASTHVRSKFVWTPC